MKEIVIRIGKDGKININTSGFQGSGCKDITQSLESALGNIEKTENKGEFYEEIDDGQSNSQSQG